MILLGVDIGTTRVKAVAYDVTQQRAIAQISTDTPWKQADHGAVHEPLALFDKVLDCLREVVATCATAGRRNNIAAICAVSLAEEIVLVDPDGTPVLDAPVWYEPRGANFLPDYVAHRGDDAAGLNPIYSLLTLRWISEQAPAARATATRFTDVASFVACRLAGRGDRLFMDYSHASRTGAFDIRSKEFDADDLDWAGGWSDAQPELVSSGKVIGVLDTPFAQELGLPSDVQIISGAHDHFAAAFACGVRHPGDAILSAGTSEAQIILSETVPQADEPGTDVGCFVDGSTYYAHRNLPAGRLFASWRTMLTSVDPARSEWFRPPTHGQLVNNPPLCLIDPNTQTISFSGLPLEATADDVMRSLSEGLAICARESLAILERAVGAPARQLTVVGPTGASDDWRLLRSAILQREMRVVTTPEPSALGAALLAQVALTGAADIPTEFVDVAGKDRHTYYNSLIAAYEGKSDS